MSLINKFILFLIIPIFSFSVHKYYISLTKIEFIQDKKEVQITMRFFIDDVEKTLENRFNIDLELATEQENKKAAFYLQKYITQKFKISINQETKNIVYLGKEYENDVVYFYLQISNIQSIHEFSVQNSMLFEEFQEQENYVKININNTKKTYILIKSNDKEMLKF